MPSVITIQRIPMLVNSGENLIESLMGSSQVALSRRLTTENKVEHKKDGRSFVSFTSYKMLHITPFTNILSSNFPELWIQYSFQFPRHFFRLNSIFGVWCFEHPFRRIEFEKSFWVVECSFVCLPTNKTEKKHILNIERLLSRSQANTKIEIESV